MKKENTPRSALHCRPQKSFSSAQAMENTRDWEKSMYDTKNLDQHHHYDFTRKKFNFCVVGGKIMELQDFSAKKLMEKLQRRLRELHFNPENKLNQNAVVDWVFSGDHDRMNEMAFGDAAKDIDFSKNADNSGLRRVGEIEQYTLAAYDLACEKFGEENVMGAFAHLDETTVHIHLPVIPVAMRKARGKKTAVYVNLKNSDLKITSKEYRNLSSAKRKEWVRKEEVEKEMSERVSYSGLVGENKEERSKWLVDFHTEFYEKVGKKYGLERGESWEELTEEERKNRRWKSARQLENERRQKEKEVEQMEEKKAELQQQVGKGAKVAAFFGVGEFAEIRTERDTANKKAEKAVKDKEKAEKALREANEARDKELTAAKAKSRQEGYSAAIEDVKRETALVTKNTAKEIGEAVMASLSRQGQLQEQIKQLQAQVSASKNASVAIAAAEKKAEIAVANTLQAVNQILSHHDMPRLTADSMKDMAATATASPFRAMFGGERMRQMCCNAIIQWDWQRKKVLEGERTPAALALLQKLWEAMRDAWQRIMNSLQEMRTLMSPGDAAEFMQKFRGVQLTPKAAMADVEQQLRFMPGPSVEGWQEALQQTESQFMAQFKPTATKQVQQHEQAGASLDVEQEQTRTAAHHR